MVDAPRVVLGASFGFTSLLFILWIGLKYRLVDTHVAFVTAISSFYIYEVVVIPLRTDDQLTPMWFTILIGGAYVFGNVRWGIIFTFFSIGGFLYVVQTSSHLVLSNEEYVTGILALICASGIFYIIKKETTNLIDRLNLLSERDPLTKLLNRRALEAKYAELESQTTSRKTELSLAILDVDNFKSINDSFGHAVGDDVIVGLAGILDSYFRESDLISRTGGDEFVIILPHCDTMSAKNLLTRAQEKFANLTNECFSNTSTKKPSLSIGLVSYFFDVPLHEALRAADHALYKAKRAGKNRVVVHKF